MVQLSTVVILVVSRNGIFTSRLFRVEHFQSRLESTMLRPRALTALLGQVFAFFLEQSTCKFYPPKGTILQSGTYRFYLCAGQHRWR